jgi:anti-sigma factor RsiW
VVNTIQNRISAADLHGIVDGHLDADRRADILRRVAASSADRALIESWQDQNDLLRSAFRDVEREPLPTVLDLSRAPIFTSGNSAIPSDRRAEAHHDGSGRLKTRLVAGGVVTLCLVAAIASILSFAGPSTTDPVVEAHLRGSVDEALSVQALSALLDETGESGTAKPTPARAAAGDLPMTTIPDLKQAGFGLTLAETSTAPAALVFHYENAAADHVTISVARATQATQDQTPARRGETFGWHKGGNAYAIAGTMAPDEVRALAVALQHAGG